MRATIQSSLFLVVLLCCLQHVCLAGPASPQPAPSTTPKSAPSSAPSAAPITRPSAIPIPHYVPPPKAAPSPSPSPSPTPPPNLPPLKMATLVTGDEGGYTSRVFYTVDPAVYFYATVAPAPAGTGKALPGPDHRSFWLSVRDPLGHEVARLGGGLAPTLDIAHADLPRDCQGHPPNGVQIAHTSLASHAGRYHAQAFLDGAAVGDMYFTIKTLRGNGTVKVTSAAVEDARGARRLTFTSKDRGVYAHITMVNLAKDREHEHLLQVAFISPQGRVGRLYGGLLVVHKGTRLDGHDFPLVCDAEHHDGIIIQGTPLAKMIGQWKMVVYLDGQPVRELPFKLVP